MTKDKSRIQSCIDHINTAVDVDPWAKELVAEMGKEILKAQLSKEDTTSDCISRQDAIRWVKTECNPYGKPTLDFESGKWVIEHLKQMPSVQPEPQWIPCSERLPEVGAFVLVSKKAFPPNVCMAHRSRDPRSGKEAWNDMLFGKLDDDRVLAWMPLPEPYEERRER